MKKTKSVIGMLALVLLFSSAFNPVETGLKEGKQAPMLKLKNSEGAVTLSELKGRYVLLNFWAGYDALSRMENIRFAREIDKSEIENISLVSVSFDTSRKVFEETIKRDGLNTAIGYIRQLPSEQRIRQLSDFARGCHHRQRPESRTIDKTYSSIIKTSVMLHLHNGGFLFLP